MTRPTTPLTHDLGPADDLLLPILSVAGMHGRALQALLTVSRVEWSDAIATACIECVERPRLRLNPAFVARWCGTPERLSMLVLHELTHITLGHTRLFPRPTAVHNIAFDAIINRSVLSMLQAAGALVHRHAELLTDFYAADASPVFLLRPPPGWPSDPDWNASRHMPPALRRIHRLLYEEADGKAGHLQLTYSEIIEALRTTADMNAGGVSLLGAHGTTEAEREALSGTRDADAGEALASVLQPLSGLLPGDGSQLASNRVRDVERTPALERALHKLLQQAVRADGGGSRRFRWDSREVTVVHRMHDRRAACRVATATALGAPAPLLFTGQIAVRKPQPTGVVIYVDVSGSMNDLLPHLRRALRTLRDEVKPVLRWFSTTVVEAQAGDLEDGRVPSTGGTSIACVMRHIVAKVPGGTPVVVLTDGFIETVPARVFNPLRERGIRIHLGVIGNGPLHERAAWVSSSTRLPSPSSIS